MMSGSWASMKAMGSVLMDVPSPLRCSRAVAHEQRPPRGADTTLLRQGVVSCRGHALVRAGHVLVQEFDGLGLGLEFAGEDVTAGNQADEFAVFDDRKVADFVL